MIESARTGNSKCLLCIENDATKKNSHIVPKFIAKSLLGKENEAKKGFVLNTNSTINKIRTVQDSPKQDFVICPSCEDYFSALETYFANNFHQKIRKAEWNSENSKTKIIDGIHFTTCENVNEKMFRLFLYSIIWRAHISQEYLFESFHLAEKESEILRTTLLDSKELKGEEILKKLESNSINENVPLVMITSETFSNTTNNSLIINSYRKNPYYFLLNEYILIFSFTNTDIPQSFDRLINIGSAKIKIGIISEELWSTNLTSIAKSIANSLQENI